MTLDSAITLSGTIFTLGGMAVTIWQTSRARNYKNQIKSDIRKINLLSVNERLKRAQDEVRRLPISVQNVPRGIKPPELIHKIREQFDIILGTLDANGPDSNVRQLLVGAQLKLNSYEIDWNSSVPKAQDVHELQAKIQDAISVLNSTIYQLEGKA